MGGKIACLLIGICIGFVIGMAAFRQDAPRATDPAKLPDIAVADQPADTDDAPAPPATPEPPREVWHYEIAVDTSKATALGVDPEAVSTRIAEAINENNYIRPSEIGAMTITNAKGAEVRFDQIVTITDKDEDGAGAD